MYFKGPKEAPKRPIFQDDVTKNVAAAGEARLQELPIYACKDRNDPEARMYRADAT